MRVIAGAVKGRRLQAPTGLRTRPMMDRVKEALFSSISQHIPDALVLDLYAGSGALGIESLSRGAGSATFVEQDGKAVTVLESVTARLANGGLMVLHRRAGEASPDAPLGTHQIDDRRYGGTQLWILEKDES